MIESGCRCLLGIVMKSRVITTTALPITITLNALPTLARLSSDMAKLNVQIQQALCTQKWGEAVKIVEQMIAIRTQVSAP